MQATMYVDVQRWSALHQLYSMRFCTLTRLGLVHQGVCAILPVCAIRVCCVGWNVALYCIGGVVVVSERIETIPCSSTVSFRVLLSPSTSARTASNLRTASLAGPSSSLVHVSNSSAESCTYAVIVTAS